MVTPIVFFDLAGPDEAALRVFYRDVFDWPVTALDPSRREMQPILAPISGRIRRRSASIWVFPMSLRRWTRWWQRAAGWTSLALRCRAKRSLACSPMWRGTPWGLLRWMATPQSCLEGGWARADAAKKSV